MTSTSLFNFHLASLAKENVEKRLVIFMVGLPARGKSYIAKKMSRFLNWMGYPTRVFNVGNYRRSTLVSSSSTSQSMDFKFFDHADQQKNQLRHELVYPITLSCHDRDSYNIRMASRVLLLMLLLFLSDVIIE